MLCLSKFKKKVKYAARNKYLSIERWANGKQYQKQYAYTDLWSLEK